MPTVGQGECFACVMTRAIGTLPAREAIVVRGGWRLAHDLGSSLPGWLVVTLLRHVDRMDELDDGEAAALGPLLKDATESLIEVTGCTKTYVMQFGEGEGFGHLHVHLVPRMPHIPEGLKGPAVFGYQGGVAVAESDRDALALKLRASLLHGSA